jgi:hypothetical protein
MERGEKQIFIFNNKPYEGVLSYAIHGVLDPQSKNIDYLPDDYAYHTNIYKLSSIPNVRISATYLYVYEDRDDPTNYGIFIDPSGHLSLSEIPTLIKELRELYELFDETNFISIDF